MYEKKCNRCQKHSYSSSRIGLWLCPYCENDLTQIQAKEADHRRVQLHAAPSTTILKKIPLTSS